MADVPTDNPAGRLHQVLSQIAHADGSQQTAMILRDVLGTDGQPDNDLFREIAAFVDLAGETYAAIHQLEDESHGLLLRWMGRFNKLVPLLLYSGNPVNQLQEHITPETLFGLEICADLLHRRTPEATLTPEKVPELIDLARQMIDAIGADDSLPTPIRLHLIGRLQEVEYALIHIRTTGYAGLESALDKLTGTVVREHQSVSKSEKTVGWWQRLMVAVGLATEGAKAIGGAVEATNKTIEIIQQINP